MKVKTEKQALLKAAQIIQNVVSVKGTLPILSNILVEAEGDKIKLTATDLEMGMYYSVPAEVMQPGALTVPARKFNEIIKELPDGSVLLSTLKNNTMSINSESVYFKLLGLPKEDFPKIPQPKEENSIELDQETLKNMLNMTMFAASRDEVRYILNGVLFSLKGSILRLVATDGRRLALAEKQIKTGREFTRSAIVPNKAAQELGRILQEEGTVKIIFADNQLIFKAQDAVLITRQIEGEFPNYEQVIPKETANKIKVDTQRLLTGARRAALLTHQDSQSIRMDLLKDKIVISKNTPELGEVKDQIDVSYKGKEMSIGFNPHYLVEALKNISQQEIDMEIDAPDKAGVIRTQLPEKYIYMVLPMQLG
ncbi:MAG: DNA polymerase III subunit beta [Candidatus Omnitrophica bacterium CG12_big_fil_rev_8_21_14_0_65_43_15]|uniref:Beta sliding clamp n=1 Tax=Candidatus Taenaricola geysiri TaxID=1974752 RepID=A0A2J0LFR9_9BACT|nr:MAG: DNA polymerase III subunit beta [Candidatus Omnitrophica bacterium CG1_02_43_210]PIW66685.1 MAG: DNA polymerase III subunit beta [Candidatus Omnitrophica bacterium CG12_big_fil_rev_8_21_14_0_65_43_15]PIW79948.1 MAG: DNA polymerase III subunit beta [Candidatus Omnitrophica bacterium CG_4_8_14_3_um_filter_43_15]PIY83880.1 MAG: DNA polymerase III subunit beta [Candidatus Omnitrophica bacterium CG_4_10_14_0_8_um_filter_43_18]